MRLTYLVFAAIFFFACSDQPATTSADSDSEAVTVADEYEKEPVFLEKIKLPEGYKIELFADGVENARSICLSPNGTLFVGTRSKGGWRSLCRRSE